MLTTTLTGKLVNRVTNIHPSNATHYYTLYYILTTSLISKLSNKLINQRDARSALAKIHRVHLIKYGTLCCHINWLIKIDRAIC